jgi:hypothetical protein
MTRWLRLLALLATLTLAGCAGSSPQGSQDAPATAESETPPLGTPTARSNATAPKISWNGCTGLGGTLSYYGNIVDVDKGRRPAGWESDAQEDHRYFFTANRCERVSVGNFERGPIHFVYEAHGGVEPPQTCFDYGEEPDDIKVLIGFWVDDPELGRFLQETYAMPIVIGTMSLEVLDQGEQDLHRWTWSTGSDDSTMAALYVAGDPGTPTYLDRLAWKTGDGVTMLDMKSEKTVSYNTPPAVTGVLAPPMAFGDGLPRPFTGAGDVWIDGSYNGPFTSFGDTACAQPLA